MTDLWFVLQAMLARAHQQQQQQHQAGGGSTGHPGLSPGGGAPSSLTGEHVPVPVGRASTGSPAEDSPGPREREESPDSPRNSLSPAASPLPPSSTASSALLDRSRDSTLELTQVAAS